jgi:hypothetical protein
LFGSLNLGNIPHWKNVWRNGDLQFIVKYDGKNFQILPISEPDVALHEWTRKKSTSLLPLSNPEHTSTRKRSMSFLPLSISEGASTGKKATSLRPKAIPAAGIAQNKIPDPSDANSQKITSNRRQSKVIPSIGCFTIY